MGSRLRQQTGPFREPDKRSAWSPATCQGSGLGRSWRHQVKISFQKSESGGGGRWGGLRLNGSLLSLETGERWHSRVASLVLEVVQSQPASRWRRDYEAGSWCGRWVQWEGQARGSDSNAHVEKADDCYSSGCS